MALFEECSPNGNLWAIVEQEDDVVCFYLHPEPGTGLELRSCWVRNLAAAPAQLDVAAMREGRTPLLPKPQCRHPTGSVPLLNTDLSIVWSEEGDSAALCEKGEILAIIPSWSGSSGFHGYARDCVGKGELCWELGTADSNLQISRYQKALQCWTAWGDGEGLWPDFQSRLVESIEAVTAPPSNYYAIDGGNWPPKAMVRIPLRDQTLLVTLGMGVRPQPKVELHFDDARPHRRVELAVSLDALIPDASVKKVAAYISGQSGLPWTRYTFLGAGHTIPADVFAELSGGKLPFALLQANPHGAPTIQLPDFRGDPMTLLWMTPISQREQEFARTHGSTELFERLKEAGIGSAHSLSRSEVV